MIDPSLREEPNLIEGLRYELFFTPVYVPIIVLGLVVLSGKQRFLDAILEECFELYL